MKGRHAIVIAVDGLRASALGAYGNTWHPTPALDALASESVVVDWMWCDAPDVAGFYRSVWGGDALPRRLADRGVAFDVVTDDRAVAEMASAASGGEVLRVEAAPAETAADAAETALGRLFAVVAERLEAWGEAPTHEGEAAGGESAGRVLWVHSRGFHGPWDAPLDLRASLLDADDPAAPTFVTPPACDAVDDHDALLACRAAYAAQAIVLDECLGALLASLAERSDDPDVLVALVGCRGFALGEHGQVGRECASLYGELLHVPCLLRVGGASPAPPRRQGLATVRDLGATLGAWMGVVDGSGGALGSVDLLVEELPGGAQPSRQCVIASGASGERAIRTTDWMLRLAPQIETSEMNSPGRAVELFAKPDDRWEANEVADRAGDVPEQLLAALERIAVAGDAAAFEPLAEFIDGY